MFVLLIILCGKDHFAHGTKPFLVLPAPLLLTAFLTLLEAPVGTVLQDLLSFCMSSEQRHWWHLVWICSKDPWKTDHVSSGAKGKVCFLPQIIHLLWGQAWPGLCRSCCRGLGFPMLGGSLCAQITCTQGALGYRGDVNMKYKLLWRREKSPLSLCLVGLTPTLRRIAGY